MAYNTKYGRQVGIIFPPALVRKLDHWIIDEGQYRSRSAVVTEAVTLFLKTQTDEPEPPSGD